MSRQCFNPLYKTNDILHLLQLQSWLDMEVSLDILIIEVVWSSAFLGIFAKCGVVAAYFVLEWLILGSLSTQAPVLVVSASGATHEFTVLKYENL